MLTYAPSNSIIGFEEEIINLIIYYLLTQTIMDNADLKPIMALPREKMLALARYIYSLICKKISAEDKILLDRLVRKVNPTVEL